MLRLFILILALTAPPLSAGELMEYRGEPLPGFTLQDLEGNPHSLEDYRGKVVMVNFWATYCPPCIEEIPSMQRLNNKLGEEKFAILAVNMAEPRGEIEAFLDKHAIEIGFPVLLDPDGAVLSQWMITAVPTTFILDPEGRIRYGLFGGLEWDKPEIVDTLSELMR
ncbi:MAG TPA: TlpA disulfide reductase family protein [Thiohalobacter sp.]|nr:TlpA disulfide reductase family protein [Thiohalobacter sp.]